MVGIRRRGGYRLSKTRRCIHGWFQPWTLWLMGATLRVRLRLRVWLRLRLRIDQYRRSVKCSPLHGPRTLNLTLTLALCLLHALALSGSPPEHHGRHPLQPRHGRHGAHQLGRGASAMPTPLSAMPTPLSAMPTPRGRHSRPVERAFCRQG